MKLIVTSLGESLDSPVDQRFGRARYFVLYDVETEEWSIHDNEQNLNAPQGAGIQAGQKVVSLGGEAVITGHCGPKAFATLSAASVDVYPQAKGTVREVIECFIRGKLGKAKNADVEQHHGSI